MFLLSLGDIVNVTLPVFLFNSLFPFQLWSLEGMDDLTIHSHKISFSEELSTIKIYTNSSGIKQGRYLQKRWGEESFSNIEN